ncbi:hypothetical protein Glove_431g19 [Diversispora epigaea]|uniref:Uncharacterized protein n=1 Tax=Diversispora epigaea TaxID=1348612 RepID=A0A397H0Z8_9GLOM|nr:hypothetical protein Glove_431g19 [Diversispora epigaea]
MIKPSHLTSVSSLCISFPSTMKSPISMNFPRIFLPSTLSSSAECKDGEQLDLETSLGTKKYKKKDNSRINVRKQKTLLITHLKIDFEVMMRLTRFVSRMG